MRLALIVPVLNRADGIESSLRALAPMRSRGHRLIVADGGSQDDTVRRACALSDRVVVAPRGWAHQANAGARCVEAEHVEALVFIPEGVRLPEFADRSIVQALSNSGSPWGRVPLTLERRRGARASAALRLADALSNGCARATGVCLRGEVVFVRRSVFFAMEGFDGNDDHALVDFSRRAGLLGAPVSLCQAAIAGVPRHRRRELLQLTWRREARRLALALGFGAPEPAR
jgi:glycosyltransferase involved in cell wall biosynthesis